MKKLLCTLILATSGIAAAKADTISIVLDQTMLYGAPNSTVHFTGTVTNLTRAPLYFTGSSITFTYTTIEGYEIGPSFPLDAGPVVLAPGASTGDVVLLNVGVPAHPDNSVSFSESFTGGPTASSNNDLGSFSVTLTSGTAPAPEINPSLTGDSILLLAGSIAILRGRRIFDVV